ncbi:MAG: response regulator [Candidatus Omnitrophota bacterium]
MGKKILLVDDEQDIVTVVTARLKANDYEVIVAYDGEAALEMAKTQNPDLIILDLMLPKMDGYKVCGLLKNDVRYSKIPIIMFTARAQEEDVLLGKEMGADDYITKPFDSMVLLEKISLLISKE